VLCAMQQSCAVVPADATLAEALAAMDEAGQARPEPACLPAQVGLDLQSKGAR